MNKEVDWLNKFLYVSSKQTSDRYFSDKNREMTTYYGNKPKNLCNYNHTHKNQENLKAARLESRIYGNYNIPNRPKDLSELIKTITNTSFNPFNSCHLANYAYKSVPFSIKNRKLYHLRREAKTLINHNGFHYLRRYFNKYPNGNQANYKSRLKHVIDFRDDFCLGEIYHELLVNYLRSAL